MKKNEPAHFVRVYDSIRRVFCITTAYRQSHRGDNRQTVDLTNQPCMCEKCRELRFSCSYVFATCFRSKINPMTLVVLEYTFFAYQATFSGNFYSFRDTKY